MKRPRKQTKKPLQENGSEQRFTFMRNPFDHYPVAARFHDVFDAREAEAWAAAFSRSSLIEVRQDLEGVSVGSAAHVDQAVADRYLSSLRLLAGS